MKSFHERLEEAKQKDKKRHYNLVDYYKRQIEKATIKCYKLRQIITMRILDTELDEARIACSFFDNANISFVDSTSHTEFRAQYPFIFSGLSRAIIVVTKVHEAI